MRPGIFKRVTHLTVSPAKKHIMATYGDVSWTDAIEKARAALREGRFPEPTEVGGRARWGQIRTYLAQKAGLLNWEEVPEIRVIFERRREIQNQRRKERECTRPTSTSSPT